MKEKKEKKNVVENRKMYKTVAVDAVAAAVFYTQIHIKSGNRNRIAQLYFLPKRNPSYIRVTWEKNMYQR